MYCYTKGKTNSLIIFQCLYLKRTFTFCVFWPRLSSLRQVLLPRCRLVPGSSCCSASPSLDPPTSVLAFSSLGRRLVSPPLLAAGFRPFASPALWDVGVHLSLLLVSLYWHAPFALCRRAPSSTLALAYFFSVLLQCLRLYILLERIPQQISVGASSLLYISTIAHAYCVRRMTLTIFHSFLIVSVYVPHSPLALTYLNLILVCDVFKHSSMHKLTVLPRSSVFAHSVKPSLLCRCPRSRCSFLCRGASFILRCCWHWFVRFLLDCFLVSTG